MGVQIPIAQAQADFASLIERVERGEEIVVTRDGRPIVRLSPSPSEGAASKGRIILGDLEGTGTRIVGSLDLPEEEIEAFYKGLDEDPL
jgi:prevent-host-death family protein